MDENVQQRCSLYAVSDPSPSFRSRDDLRILIAEDHLAVRKSLVRMLAKLGFSNISTACNGTELVRQARAVEPNIIISDVNMPGMSGPAALDQIPSTMCILMSGLPFPQAWCEENADRIAACIRKPFRIEEIEAAMNAVELLME